MAYVVEHLGEETPKCAVEFVGADLRKLEERQLLFKTAAERGPVLVRDARSEHLRSCKEGKKKEF